MATYVSEIISLNINKMILYKNTNRGLVRTIVIVLIALVILSYFGLNLRSIINSEAFQDNWDFLTGFLANIWSNYIKPAVIFVWERIIRPLIGGSGSEIIGIAAIVSATSSPK